MTCQRLRLFAIAVAENLYRKNLTPEERREALHRLKQYYEEVYPPSRNRSVLPGALTSPAQYPSFSAWAAKQFNISRRTISKDLRLAQLAQSQRSAAVIEPTTGQDLSHAQEFHPENQVSEEKGDPIVTQLQHTTAALRELLLLLSREHTSQLPEAEFEDFQQALEAAQELCVQTTSVER